MRPGIERQLAFGHLWEDKLKDILERHIGWVINKTAYEFDTIDFETFIRLMFAELKSRPRYNIRSNKYQDSKTYKTWWVPECKLKKAAPDVILRFYYFWEADNTLWFVDYDEKLFRGFHRERNFNGQMTIHIPRELFQPVTEATCSDNS